MTKHLSFLLLLFVCASCTKSNSNIDSKEGLKSGIYRASFKAVNGVEIPFMFKIERTSDSSYLTLWNAKERLKFLKGRIKDGSIKYSSTIFNSFIILENSSSDSIRGIFVHEDRNSNIPFSGKLHKDYTETSYKRFAETPDTVDKISGSWTVNFDFNGSSENAIGEFSMENNRVFGSFLTESGDYRYLEGVVSSNKLMISGFSGAVVFYFSGEIRGDEIINGRFIRGTGKEAKWTASRGVKDGILRDQDEITKLTNKKNELNFSFPSATIDGVNISLSDPKYKNKVVIVQIMGTWCHNCMDETKYLGEVYSKYNFKGLEIVGLAFETRAKTLKEAKANIAKTKENLNVSYDIAIATFGKENLDIYFSQQIGGIKSFPTAIYIGKDGSVKKIHTGFFGPGTSKYKDFVNTNKKYIEQLLEN